MNVPFLIASKSSGSGGARERHMSAIERRLRISELNTFVKEEQRSECDLGFFFKGGSYLLEHHPSCIASGCGGPQCCSHGLESLSFFPQSCNFLSYQSCM
jgi:hypothetical protein